MLEGLLLAVLGGLVEALASGKLGEALAAKVKRAEQKLADREGETFREAIRRAVETARIEVLEEYWPGGEGQSRELLALLDRPLYAQEVVRRVLVRGPADLGSLREEFLRTAGGSDDAQSGWERLEAPLDSFFDAIESQLAADPVVGGVFRDARQFALQRGIEKTNREIAETTHRLAATAEQGVGVQREQLAEARRQTELLEELRRGLRVGESLDAETLAAYLRSLAAECSRLPFAQIDPRFAEGAGERAVGLERVYVDLDVAAGVRKQGRGGKAETDELERLAGGLRAGGARTPVLEALAADESRFAVLLGDAGSGKTTFAHYLTILLARGGGEVPEALRGLVPVRLVLRDVARAHLAGGGEGTAATLWDAVEADCRRRLPNLKATSFAAALEAQALAGGVFLVLDGLDEVPEARSRRQELLSAVGKVAASLGGRSRVLVTARPYAYADPAWRLPNFAVLELAPFDEGQIARFIGRWYDAVASDFHWDPETAAGRGRELADAVRERGYLGKLAERPLLLTLMATLHSSWGRLPDDRADLYKEIIHLLLGRWQRFRMAKGADGEEVPEPGISEVLQVGEEKIRQRLEELAFRVHQAERKPGAQPAEAADVAEGEVLLAFKPLLRDLDPELLLGYLRHRAGLLVERRSEVYAFPHRSFQEYLAASYLSERPQADTELRKRVVEDPAWWREVYLLAVGKARQGGLPRAVSAVRALLATPPDGAGPDLAHRLAALAGEALVELRLDERAGEDLAVYQDLVVDDVRRRLTDLVEGGHLPPRERLAAGLALGRLGDRRPGVGRVRVGDQEIPDIEWREIPAGSFRMGGAEGEEDPLGNERPAAELSLPSFFLSRYPVTNAQYAAFLEAGGYDRDELWSAEGRAWREGAEADLSEIPEKVRDEWRTWLEGRPAERRRRPYWWGDARWAAATCPVVGVTWFEAQAFCRWLGEVVRALPWWLERRERLSTFSIRLPTEAEWERAARGGGDGSWPWEGDDFGGGDRANTSETGLGGTSPVGMFPHGRNPFGLDDVAGNVWEWTSSLYRPYRYLASDGREDPYHPGPRVLRGGSWILESRNARCAARGRNDPSFFYYNIGFRCGVFPGLPSSS